MSFFKLNASGQFSAKTKDQIGALLASPLVADVFAQAERELLADRRQLIEELARLVPKFDAATAAVEMKAVKANQRVAELDSELKAARRALSDAQLEGYGLALSVSNDRIRIERTLREKADPRLEEFAFECDQIMNGGLKMALESWTETTDNTMFGVRNSETRSNLDKVLPADATLRECIANCYRLQLTEMSTADGNLELEAMCNLLSGPLAGVFLNAPQLSDDVQVGSPLAWRGTPAWRVAKLEDVGATKRELLMENLMAEMAKNGSGSRNSGTAVGVRAGNPTARRALQ